MDNDKEVPLAFPTSGLNVATSYGQQPDASTPIGVNVRANESILNRARGGSRSGLSRYPPGILPSGDNVVQHMNVVVDPQGGALLAGSPLTDPSEEDPDPRWTRMIRTGGDGIQMNRNVNRPMVDQLVQSTSGSFGFSDGTFSTNFGSQPLSGNLLVVVATAVVLNSQGNSPPIGAFDIGGIQNGAGTAFTQVGSGGYYSTVSIPVTVGPTNYTNFFSLSIWYLYSTGSASDQTVTVTSPNTGSELVSDQQVQINCFEYNGTTGAPINKARNSSGSNDTSWTSTALSLSNTPNELVIAAMIGGNSPGINGSLDACTPAGGFRATGDLSGVAGLDIGTVGDKQGVKATTITPVFTASGAGGNYCAIATAFNHR